MNLLHSHWFESDLLVIQVVLDFGVLDGGAVLNLSPVELHLSGQLELDSSHRNGLVNLDHNMSGDLRSGDVVRIILVKKDLEEIFKV